MVHTAPAFRKPQVHPPAYPKLATSTRHPLISPPPAVRFACGLCFLLTQFYLLAIAWAIAGIAAEKGYRRDALGADLASGVNEALQGLWIALLCVAVLGVLAGMRQRNQAELEDYEGKRRSSTAAHRHQAQSGLTSAIYSS